MRAKAFLCLAIMSVLLLLSTSTNLLPVNAQQNAAVTAQTAVSDGVIGYNIPDAITTQFSLPPSPLTGDRTQDGVPGGIIVPDPGDQTASVVGTDTRKIVTNTNIYPFSTICQIVSTFPDGTQTVGSGALIAPQYVLTAAHVIYDTKYGGFVRAVRVTPGLNGLATPFGAANGIYGRTHTGYINLAPPANADYDMGILTLDRAIGYSTGWLGFAAYSQIIGRSGNLAGYPVSKDALGRQLWRSFGYFRSAQTALLFNHDIDATGGESGACIYVLFKNTNQRYVYAVHKGNNVAIGLNLGVIIDAVKFDIIVNALNSGF